MKFYLDMRFEIDTKNKKPSDRMVFSIRDAFSAGSRDWSG